MHFFIAVSGETSGELPLGFPVHERARTPVGVTSLRRPFVEGGLSRIGLGSRPKPEGKCEKEAKCTL